MKALFTMKRMILVSALVLILISAASLSAEVHPTNKWINVYGNDCLLNGNPLPIGAIIDAYDPDGVHCGRWIVTETGTYGFMPVYLDWTGTPELDEGAEVGDEITLIVNGTSTLELGPDSPVWTENGDSYNVNLSATQDISMQVTAPLGQFTSPSQSLIYIFQVENTGSGIDFYNLAVESEHGWTAEFVSASAQTDYVDPSQVLDVRVRVTVPSDIFNSIVDSLFLTVTSGMDGTVSTVGKTFTTVIATSIEDDNSSILPGKFALSQNYPNPFNPETVINYSLKKSGYVHLEIYNLLGQSADVLIDEHQDAGEYSVAWNALDSGRNYPSGVYFYRLTVDDQTLTRKMILMK